MARPHPALIEIAAGRPAPGSLDASELVRSALEHKVGGLLWSRVASGDVPLSTTWLEALQRHDIRSWARHTRFRESLGSIRSRLAAIGVPIATAKGISAEARWYGRVGERTCFDLDVLIGPDHFSRIDDVIATLHPDHELRGTARALIAANRLLSMNLDVDGTPVDLHFDMLKLDLLPSRQRRLVWDRREAFRFDDGLEVDVLDAETSLVQLLLQLNKDSLSYLLGFADVVRLCQREDLDWAFIERFMRAEGLESQLHATLEVAFETLRIPLPVKRMTRGWRAAWWHVIWRPSRRLQGDAGIIASQRRNWWLPLTARGRLGEAIKAVVGRAFPPPAVVSYYYPGARGPYLWRLLSGRLARLRRQRRLVENIDELRSRRVPGAATGPAKPRS